jgi:hypothetical protein
MARLAVPQCACAQSNAQRIFATIDVKKTSTSAKPLAAQISQDAA